MYLYVFVFIILSIMSIYMELFSLRVAHINEKQTSGAEIMFTWHNGAYKYVKKNVDIDSMTIDTNCSVSPTYNPKCKDGSAINTFLTANNIGSYQYLPVNFNFNFISTQFPSYVFKDSNGVRIITFVYNGNRSMGLTSGQMIQQIVRSKFPAISYGSIQVNKCDGSASGNHIKSNSLGDWSGHSFKPCYNVPSSFQVGSVGIISILK